jgi:HlyD family secretion protein
LGREADRETREFIVDVQVLKLPENWAVGQRAEVYIETDRKSSAVLLPAKFLVRRDDQAGVYLNQSGRSEWRPVRAGLRSMEAVEVIEGLEPGETVVVPSDPTNSLREGQRIVIS